MVQTGRVYRYTHPPPSTPHYWGRFGLGLGTPPPEFGVRKHKKTRRSNGQNGKETCLLVVVACLLPAMGEGCSNTQRP